MRRNNQQQGGGRYDNRGGGEGGYNRDRDRDRDQPRRGDRGGRGGGSREPPVFGIVISMKEVFGFLQPLLPSQVPGEEHLYFNEKDIVGERLQEGDEVQYVVRSGPRGPVAAQVRRLEGGVKVKKPKVIGIVEKEAEQYKFFPGLISVANYPQFTADGAEVEASEGTAAISHSVPYMPVDVSKGSRRLMKGDEVEFDLYVIPMAAQKGQNQTAGYCRCHSIKLVRSRNDRLIAEQVKELENSGVAREQGVIDTIKNDFGFLRPADRQEQIFFRLEDVLDSKEHLPNEGDEVEFYVISETVKGRTAERAVHLKFLPHGTVQFEETLGTGMRAVVVTEPRLHPREEPGLMRLCQPLIVTGSEAPIETVELWSRCLPEGFGLMRCGDELEIDVTKYRPEKLIFARNAKVCSYLSLGRAFGSVCDVKAAGGYGFIRSAQGDPDCYFRTAEVLGDSGVLIPDKRVKVGQLVSYEILQETSRGGSTRMKAMRVQICSEDNFRHRKATLQKEVHGTIVREARKGDHHAVGSIELSEELVDTQIPCYDVFTSHQDLYCALQDFRDNVHLKEVTVRHFLPYQRYALHMLLRHHFTGIAHATVDGMKRGKAAAETESEVQVLSLTEDNLNAVTNSVATASAAANANVDVSLTENNSSPSKKKGKKSSLDDDDAVPQEIRIWKIEDPAEFAVWSKANDALLQGPSRYDGKKNNIVSFQKADLVDSLSGGGGGARAGSDVTFDVCVDRVTGARVAANVKVSDVQAEGGEWPQLGCLEYFRADGDMHGGYIRSVPSDEKLMWNQLVRSTDENDDVAADSHSRQEWKLGSIVSFEIRVRGGIRYAAGVAIVPPESDLAPQKEVELDGVVRGVIVESPATKGGVAESGPGSLSVYIVDTSECPSMTNKIVSLTNDTYVLYS
jgi:cold shock CspA family protein